MRSTFLALLFAFIASPVALAGAHANFDDVPPTDLIQVDQAYAESDVPILAVTTLLNPTPAVLDVGKGGLLRTTLGDTAETAMRPWWCPWPLDYWTETEYVQIGTLPDGTPIYEPQEVTYCGF